MVQWQPEMTTAYKLSQEKHSTTSGDISQNIYYSIPTDFYHQTKADERTGDFNLSFLWFRGSCFDHWDIYSGIHMNYAGQSKAIMRAAALPKQETER